MSERKKSQWLLLSCGCCAGIIILLVAALGGSVFFGVNLFKGMVSDLADPEARQAAALEVLGAETLPAGWHTHLYFKIPWLFQMVVLTDGEPPEEVPGQTFEEQIENLENLTLRHDRLGPNLFLYVRVRSDEETHIEDMISGRGGPSGSQLDLDIEVESVEQLTQGELEATSGAFSYTTHRGLLVASDREAEGLYTTFSFSCGDGQSRQALWFQRAEDAARSLLGSPAEESAIQALVSQFDICN